MFTAASVMKSGLGWCGRSNASTWLIRRSVLRPVILRTAASMISSVWNAPLHQGRDLAGARERHRRLGRPMAVRPFDELEA